MPAGSNAIGFAGGFARGFANQYVAGKERQRKEAREAEDKKIREFQYLNPMMLKRMEDTGDALGYQQWLTTYFPDLAAEAKRAGSGPADHLTPLLKMAAPMSKDQIAMHDEQSSAITAGTGEPAELPFRPTPVESVPSPDPKSFFFGAHMPTPDERAERTARAEGKADTIKTQMAQDARRKIAEQLKMKPADAVRYIATGQMSPDRQLSLTPSQLFDDYVTAKEKDKGSPLTPTELLAARKEWEAADASQSSLYRYGVDREALAKALFNKPYNDLSRAQAEVVLNEEKTMLEAEAKARGTGTADAKFEAPVDIPTAQDAGVPVGTTAASVAGQAVPTIPQGDRRRSVEELKTNLTEIMDGYTDPATGEKVNLLDAFPTEAELPLGLAPGLVYAARRRMPSYRNKIAALESRVNNIVNVMARSVGEQRGTQTERDALRAEAAIGEIRDAFLTGDTQESARTRIEQSLRVLDGILSRLPNAPQPRQPVARGAAPKATGAGTPAPGMTTDEKGNIYQDGKLIVPVQ